MKLKKKFIAVIGNRNSGKSTIIRSVTGVNASTSPERVTDLSTKKWILVVSHSPQEQPISPDQLRKEMKVAATNALSLGMVIALQPNNPTSRLSIEDVFEMAQGCAFECHVFVIEKPYKGSDGTDPEIIRERLVQFDIKTPIQSLDARRFAHMNAAVIRDIVGWF